MKGIISVGLSAGIVLATLVLQAAADGPEGCGPAPEALKVVRDAEGYLVTWAPPKAGPAGEPMAFVVGRANMTIWVEATNSTGPVSYNFTFEIIASVDNKTFSFRDGTTDPDFDYQFRVHAQYGCGDGEPTGAEPTNPWPRCDIVWPGPIPPNSSQPPIVRHECATPVPFIRGPGV